MIVLRLKRLFFLSGQCSGLVVLAYLAQSTNPCIQSPIRLPILLLYTSCLYSCSSHFLKLDCQYKSPYQCGPISCTITDQFGLWSMGSVSEKLDKWIVSAFFSVPFDLTFFFTDFFVGELSFYLCFTVSSLDLSPLYFFVRDLLLLFFGLGLLFYTLFLSTSIVFLAILIVFTIDMDLPTRFRSAVLAFFPGSVLVLMVLLLATLSLLRLVWAQPSCFFDGSSSSKCFSLSSVLLKKLSCRQAGCRVFFLSGDLALHGLALKGSLAAAFFCFWVSLYFQYLILSFSDSMIIICQCNQICMLKLTQEIQTGGPATELSRNYNTIYAYEQRQELLQIDLKHQLITRNRLTYPPRNVRCFNWEGVLSYFVITLNRIERWGGGLVSESNSKAQFTGPIDCSAGALLFAKYHINYKKYSINHLWEGNKQIVKLTDEPIRKLIFNPTNSQVIYSLKDTVSCFDLQDPEKETLLFKKCSCLHDAYNLYLLTANLENKAKEKYECGIFDFRNGKLSDSWISSEIPIKIQSFAKTLLVTSSNAVELYDVRKLLKPFEYERVRGIRDFLYEPNLSKLFIGTESSLRVYSAEW